MSESSHTGSDGADGHGEPDHHAELDERVRPFELFFDLVFVFAFTQVTAMLAADVSWPGLLRGMLVLAACWWAWAAYAWLASSIDLDSVGPRLVTLLAMGAMLIAGIAVPGAFAESAGVFAIAYAAVRVLHLALYVVAARERPDLMRNVVRLVPTSTVAAGLILVAAWQDGWVEPALWLAALAFDYLGPVLVGPDGWIITPGHFGERHGLIFIVALGESLIAIGVGAGDLDVSGQLVGTAVLGMLVVSAMWWTYFDVVAIVAEQRLASLRGAAQAAMARDSYSYLHLPMVAGVILFALGVKKTMAHPGDALEPVTLAALSGGVALYLVAHVLFRLRNLGSFNAHRSIAAVALTGLGIAAAAARDIPAWWVLGAVASICAALVAYETIYFREARKRVRRGDWQASS